MSASDRVTRQAAHTLAARRAYRAALTAPGATWDEAAVKAASVVLSAEETHLEALAGGAKAARAAEAAYLASLGDE